MPILEKFVYLCREYSHTTKFLKIMVQIEEQDLMIFEDLLIEKVERLGGALKRCGCKNQLYDSILSSFRHYEMSYERVSSLILEK